MWAGHPDGFLQVYPIWAGHPDGFLQVTLALRGLEEPFSSCAVCCVSFWFWREKGFGSILVQIRIYYLEYNTVVVVR